MDLNKNNLNKDKTGSSPEADALLKRGYMLLEAGEWDKARKYFSRSLDLDPENPQTYLGRLMSHLKVKNKEDLKNVSEPFDHSKNYANIMRFADAELKEKLQGYNEHIKARNTENAYNKAKRLMDVANSENSYIKARDAFKGLGNYKDSNELLAQCKIKIDEIQTKNREEAAKLKEETSKRNKKH